MKRIERVKCPKHVVPLAQSRTRYGLRYACPEPGCSVVYWPGPYSTPADAETRALRRKCHEAFDPLWIEKDGPFSEHGHTGARRRAAYRWLADAIGVGMDEAHVGMMNSDRCHRLLSAIDELRTETA